MSHRLHILLAVLLGLPLAEARADIGFAADPAGDFRIAMRDDGVEEPTGRATGTDDLPADQALPFDSDSGRTIVPLESWPTFPILRTECLRNFREDLAEWYYYVHFRSIPVAPVSVLLVSESGEMLAEATLSPQDGSAFRPCSTKGPCGQRRLFVLPYGDSKARMVPPYLLTAWDPRRQVVIQSELGDSSYIAEFDFSGQVSSGNALVILVGGTEIYRERIPIKVEFDRPVRAFIPPLTPEEDYQLFVDREIRAMRDRGATEEEIRQHRLWLETLREGWGEP